MVITSKDTVQHQGISLTMEGSVNLQLSSKSVGVFEAFYNSVKVRPVPVNIFSTKLLPFSQIKSFHNEPLVVTALCGM